MKGNAKVVKRLNEVLTNELTAIDQYFVHAKMFEHWGFAPPGRIGAQGLDRRDEARRRR